MTITFDISHSALYLQPTIGKINILPVQSQQFTAPHTGYNCQREQRLQTMIFYLLEQRIRLLSCEYSFFLARYTRWCYGVAYITRKNAPLNRIAQSFMQQSMNVVDGFG